MKQTLLVILLLALLPITHLSARNNGKARAAVLENNRGYYKELFMDGGIALNSRKVLPATDNLGIKMDFYASSINPKLTAKDTNPFLYPKYVDTNISNTIIISITIPIFLLLF